MIDLGRVNSEGENVLILSVRQNDVFYVRKWIELGINTEVKNKKGETALHIARELGYSELVDVLLAEAVSKGLWFINAYALIDYVFFPPKDFFT